MARRRILKLMAVASRGSVQVLLHGWALVKLYFWFRSQVGGALAAVVGLPRLGEPESGLSDAPASGQSARVVAGLNFLTVHGMRDFRYRSASDFDARWSTRSFDLEKLGAVDLFLAFPGCRGSPM